MARTAEPKTHAWTREEYYRLAEAGVFGAQRVQLVEGEIVEMSPQSSRHAVGIRLVTKTIERLLEASHDVRVQLPLDLGARSQPEPDVAVVAGAPRQYARAHPTTALLVVEVADTTRDYDLGEKASLYAKAGIPEYWVVDLVQRRLVVHRAPAVDSAAPFGHGYADVASLGPTDGLPGFAGAPAGAATVADLLP